VPTIRPNIDCATVAGFGKQWKQFDQSRLADVEKRDLFNKYFAVFPWHSLSAEPIGFDMGCGSGRWTSLVAPRVHHLHCIDASKEALAVAERNLRDFSNCSFHLASVSDRSLEANSMDFGYSLGVLHHVPDINEALKDCVRMLKPGAPLLVYLYYAFDNKPWWFKRLWSLTEGLRYCVSRMPHPFRFAVSQFIALSVYFPLARIAWLLEKLGMCVDSLPLAFYRGLSFYTMQTDALDRFGTQFTQRFTREEITEMLKAAELENIVFHDGVPYWCAVGRKQQ